MLRIRRQNGLSIAWVSTRRGTDPILRHFKDEHIIRLFIGCTTYDFDYKHLRIV